MRKAWPEIIKNLAIHGSRRKKVKKSKLVIFISFLLLLIGYVEAEEIPGFVKDQIKINQKYHSHNEEMFAIAIPYSNSVGTEDSGVFIHKKDHDVYIRIPNLVGVKMIEWSPDDSYLIIDNGTSSYRGFICYRVKDFKEIGVFQRRSDEYSFLDNDSIIATVEKGYRVEGMVAQYGIDLIKITGDGLILYDLLVPDELYDYRFKEIQDEDVLIEKIVFENTDSESPWARYKKDYTDLIVLTKKEIGGRIIR